MVVLPSFNGIVGSWIFAEMFSLLYLPDLDGGKRDVCESLPWGQKNNISTFQNDKLPMTTVRKLESLEN